MFCSYLGVYSFTKPIVCSVMVAKDLMCIKRLLQSTNSNLTAMLGCRVKLLHWWKLRYSKTLFKLTWAPMHRSPSSKQLFWVQRSKSAPLCIFHCRCMHCSCFTYQENIHHTAVTSRSYVSSIFSIPMNMATYKRDGQRPSHEASTVFLLKSSVAMILSFQLSTLKINPPAKS